MHDNQPCCLILLVDIWPEMSYKGAIVEQKSNCDLLSLLMGSCFRHLLDIGLQAWIHFEMPAILTWMSCGH